MITLEDIQMFCKHDYEVMNKTILPSMFEDMHAGNILKVKSYPAYGRKVVFLLKCAKCKDVKKLVEAQP